MDLDFTDKAFPIIGCAAFGLLLLCAPYDTKRSHAFWFVARQVVGWASLVLFVVLFIRGVSVS